ncbi:MAG: flagellar hook-length control protein FliK [Bacillota bacterium]
MLQANFEPMSVSLIDTRPARPASRRERTEPTEHSGSHGFAEHLRRAGAGKTSRAPMERAGLKSRSTDRRRHDPTADQTAGQTERAALAGQNGWAERAEARPDGTREAAKAVGLTEGTTRTAQTPDGEPQGPTTGKAGTKEAAPTNQDGTEPQGPDGGVARALTEKAEATAADTSPLKAVSDQAIQAMIAEARGKAQGLGGTARTGAPAKPVSGDTPNPQGAAAQGTAGKDGAGPTEPVGLAAGAVETDQARNDGQGAQGVNPGGLGQVAQGTGASAAQAQTQTQTQAQTQAVAQTQGQTLADQGSTEPDGPVTGTVNLENGSSQMKPAATDAAARTGTTLRTAENTRKDGRADGDAGQMAQAAGTTQGSAGTTEGQAKADLKPVAGGRGDGTGRAPEGDATGRTETRKAGGEPGTAKAGRPQTVDDPTAGQLNRTAGQDVRTVRTTEASTSGAEAGKPASPRPDPKDLIRQIVAKASVRGDGNGGEMRVQLKPEYLGPLNLRVIVERGGVTAHLTTQNQLVKQALEAALPQLKEALAGQGLRTDHIAVTLGQDAFSAQMMGQGATARGRPGWDRGTGRESFSQTAVQTVGGIATPARGRALTAIRPNGGHALDYVA